MSGSEIAAVVTASVSLLVALIAVILPFLTSLLGLRFENKKRKEEILYIKKLEIYGAFFMAFGSFYNNGFYSGKENAEFCNAVNMVLLVCGEIASKKIIELINARNEKADEKTQKKLFIECSALLRQDIEATKKEVVK